VQIANSGFCEHLRSARHEKRKFLEVYRLKQNEGKEKEVKIERLKK